MYDVNQIHDPKTAAYEAEVKRMTGQYGLGAEIPRPPTNTLVGGPLGRQPVAVRIEDLANQAATAGHELTSAREEYLRAALVREQATKRFISVTEALFQAIQEHRERTPENVPYQP